MVLLTFEMSDMEWNQGWWLSGAEEGRTIDLWRAGEVWLSMFVLQVAGPAFVSTCLPFVCP